MELRETTDGQVVFVKKAPRKPRPSEIAAKKAKAAKASKKRAKAFKKKVRKVAKPKAKKSAKRKAPAASKAVRTERLDMRVTKADKRKLEGVAKRRGIPVTYVVLGAIAKLR